LLDAGFGFFYNHFQIFPNQFAKAMAKRRNTFVVFFVALLFALACAYSLFDNVREADSLSPIKYEGRDINALCAEKCSGLDGVLVSAYLFSPLPDTLFDFLPGFFSPDSFWVKTFSVLRC
jgi:hypothetical protein